MQNLLESLESKFEEYHTTQLKIDNRQDPDYYLNMGKAAGIGEAIDLLRETRLDAEKQILKKVYIAGKVTGEPFAECKAKFDQVQEKLEKMGFEAVNPMMIVTNIYTTWEDAMKVCIHNLVSCDAVVLLDDWESSTGAKIERQLAEDLNLTICNATEEGLKVLKINLT